MRTTLMTVTEWEKARKRELFKALAYLLFFGAMIIIGYWLGGRNHR